MNPYEGQPISVLLRKYNLRPRKGLGQNFLTDPFHLGKIIDIADLTPNDTVLEVGPGPGTLTRLLAAAAGQVIAIELDPEMVKLLQVEYGHLENLTIVEADILETDINALLPPRTCRSPAFKVVANLPYYITSAAVRHLLEASPRPERLVITVQKEVALRMVAEPGKMSLLAVSVQFYGQPKLAHHIPAGAFYPSPNVDSAVVCIDTFAQPPLAVEDMAHFFQVVKAGFGQKRKQLKNALAAGLHRSSSDMVMALKAAKIDPARRAETLSMAEWGRLAKVIT